MKLDILAFGVHPDDVELGAGGTVLKHIALGKKVGIVDLTRGELGTRGTAETRDEEAAMASKFMGAAMRANLGFADGFFKNDQEHQLAVIEMIRFLKPDIVLANAVSDRHPDHGRAAQLVAEACFYAGLSKIETTWDGEPQEKWRPAAVYHYIQDYNLEPDFIVDINGYVDRKLELVQCYKTQFYDPTSTEPQTPISGKDFLEFVVAKARTYGRAAGFEYGEGFTTARTVGVASLFDIA